jgi:ABC-2 type transport system ATP-binding protein
MSQPVIHLQKLGRQYTIHEREAGAVAAIRSLFIRRKRIIRAVDSIDLTLHAGEVVGFLGPNGAGKTTTLKMLSGLLHPTSGTARVLGHEPWKRERDFLSRITLVMGQRNQLAWDIPAADSYALNRVIFGISPQEYRRTLDELVELLDLSALIRKPVRNLSLGERMKCEIAGALLHRPQVLFLDEPTLGLDVTAQRRIRQFIAEYNRRHNATVLLTSHYMADVEALCRRVVIIDQGKILFDGDLAALIKRFSPHKTITLELAESGHDLQQYGELIEQNGSHASLRVPQAQTPAIAARLLAELPVNDFTVTDPPIEMVIDEIFNRNRSRQVAQEAQDAHTA